ncbi:MAG TPA: membrane protein insertase YidC [Barnesiella sp.]|nr:membrane protein insertase YidC [Bacteroides sp. CAG:144]HBX17047.1 membrane protein insertase YidC [Barnesiella sp.]
MDRNTIIGFLLMALVLFGYTWYMQPSPEQKAAMQRYQDSLLQVENTRLAEINNVETAATDPVEEMTVDEHTLRLRNEYVDFAPFAEGEEKTITLSNPQVTLTFSTHGGRLTQAILNEYNTYDSLPVMLFNSENNAYGFIFKAQGRTINTADLYFVPELSADNRTLSMKLPFENGSSFEVRYTLPEEGYMLDMKIYQNGMENILPRNTVDLDMYWSQMLRRQERGRMFEERNSALYYKFVGSDVERLSETKDEHESITTGLKWIGFKNQFFSSVLIADRKLNGARLESTVLPEDNTYLKSYKAETTVDYDPMSTEGPAFRFFLGPNLYPLLKSYDKGLDSDDKLQLPKLIPLGYKFFRWINTGIIIPIFTFLGKYFTNYGVIILLMTLIIKAVLMPLTFKSYMSSARMRVLKPQMEEINAKYPGQDKAMDRQRATMELYSNAGVNPMSGCLPLLLQMPILLAMFAFFPSSIELRQQPFLWADDLSSYDAIFTWDAYIPLITPYFGNHISLFCLLMTITNILYTKINMDSTGGGQQMPGMKLMMYLMPLMFLFIFNNYASGLSYYYFVSLLITIIQTYIFRKCINEEKVLAKLKENQKKPRKKSGFMARLEEAQRQQQAALKRQQQQRRR